MANSRTPAEMKNCKLQNPSLLFGPLAHLGSDGFWALTSHMYMYIQIIHVYKYSIWLSELFFGNWPWVHCILPWPMHSLNNIDLGTGAHRRGGDDHFASSAPLLSMNMCMGNSVLWLCHCGVRSSGHRDFTRRSWQWPPPLRPCAEIIIVATSWQR